jgi:hypothetical protein
MSSRLSPSKQPPLSFDFDDDDDYDDDGRNERRTSNQAMRQ